MSLIKEFCNHTFLTDESKSIFRIVCEALFHWDDAIEFEDNFYQFLLTAKETDVQKFLAPLLREVATDYLKTGDGKKVSEIRRGFEAIGEDFQEYVMRQSISGVYAEYATIAALAEWFNISFYAVRVNQNNEPIECSIGVLFKSDATKSSAANVSRVKEGLNIIVIKDEASEQFHLGIAVLVDDEIQYKEMAVTEQAQISLLGKIEALYKQDHQGERTGGKLRDFINTEDCIVELNRMLQKFGSLYLAVVRDAKPIEIYNATQKSPHHAGIIKLYNRDNDHFFIGKGEYSSTVGDGNCFFNGFAQWLRYYILVCDNPSARLLVKQYEALEQKDGKHILLNLMEELEKRAKDDISLKSLLESLVAECQEKGASMISSNHTIQIQISAQSHQNSELLKTSVDQCRLIVPVVKPAKIKTRETPVQTEDVACPPKQKKKRKKRNSQMTGITMQLTVGNALNQESQYPQADNFQQREESRESKQASSDLLVKKPNSELEKTASTDIISASFFFRIIQHPTSKILGTVFMMAGFLALGVGIAFLYPAAAASIMAVIGFGIAHSTAVGLTIAGGAGLVASGVVRFFGSKGHVPKDSKSYHTLDTMIIRS